MPKKDAEIIIKRALFIKLGFLCTDIKEKSLFFVYPERI